MAATPRPWKVVEPEGSLWIEGAPGSAASQNLPKDSRVVCDFRLFGNADLDREMRENANLVVELVNGGEHS